MKSTFSLVIETSTPFASLATISANGELTQRDFTSNRSHNASLFAPLEELLAAQDTAKVGLVLVGSGPGSYSGTRVGIAAAQGVAIASSCLALAVPSILAVPSGEDGASYVVIGDARRGSFWFAEVCEYQLIRGPELTDATGLCEVVSNILAVGRNVVTFEESSRFPLPTAQLSCVRQEFPSAARLWKVWEMSAAATREKWEAEIPQPIYLKPPHITPAKRPWLV